MSIGKAITAVLFTLSAGVCMAQSQALPVDAAGRPVRDRAGAALEYDTAATGTGATLATAAPQGARRTAKPRAQMPSVWMAAAGAPSYVQTWRTASFGQGIGGTGIWAADLDSDGEIELVLGGGRGFGANALWSIVGHSAAGGYEIEWQSEPYDDPFGSITALRLVDTGNEWRVWIGLGDGRIDVVDALTRELVATFTDAGEAITDFALADADNDGTLDVLAAAGSQILLYDAVSPAFTRAYPYAAAKVAVGNVDADSLLEVVLNTGRVLEIDGNAAAEQWSTEEFGARIDLGDIDGDGMAELVGAEAWSTIRAWDLDANSVKWSVTADLDIGAMRLIDVTGDGVPELVYGDGQWGSLYALDAATRAELWRVANPEHGVTDIAFVDADGDGENELLWGAGWTSSGPDYLYVYDPANDALEWQSTDYSGPYHAVDIGDVDADGEPELVVASYQSESGYADGLVFVFDATTHALEWHSDGGLFGRNAWTGVHDLVLENVDDDPQLEIVVGTDRLYDGALYVIDGLTHAKQKEWFYDSGNPLNVLDSGDLTGDGVPEIVAGNFVEHTGSPGVFLYALDPLTGGVIWKSASLASGFDEVTDIALADVGLPGIDLIAAATGNVQAVRWSDKRHLTSFGPHYLSVTAGDLAGTEEQEILAGRNDGTVDVLNGEDLSLITGYSVCAEPVTALAMQAPKRFLATCGSNLVVYDVDSAGAVNTASSAATLLGNYGSIVTGVVNGRAVVLAGGSEAVQLVDDGGNTLPVVSPASATLHWRGEADLDLSATDADGDPLTFELTTRPALGTAVWLDQALGTLRYTAGGIDKGIDSFEVRASDGLNYSAPQTIELTLENAAPQGDTPTVELHWRGAQTSAVSTSDPDGDPLTYALVAAPAQGAAELNAATGALTYTPSTAYVGPDSLEYSASDGADTATEVVDIVLTNTAPTAGSRDFQANGAVIASRFPAEDANDDPLTYSVVSGPEQGELTFEEDTGLFEYTPAANGSGTDSVTFAASDGIDAAQGVIEIRYVSSSPAPGNDSGGGGGGGGGAAGWLLLLLAGGCLGFRVRPALPG